MKSSEFSSSRELVCQFPFVAIEFPCIADKYICMQCEQQEANCRCTRYCCLCQSEHNDRLVQDGNYYWLDCREACDFQSQYCGSRQSCVFMRQEKPESCYCGFLG